MSEKQNLLNARLVWMTDEDLSAINLAVNIAQNAVHGDSEGLCAAITDLDGDNLTPELLASWRQATDEAVSALCRSKWVPDEPLLRLRLILMSG